MNTNLDIISMTQQEYNEVLACKQRHLDLVHPTNKFNIFEDLTLDVTDKNPNFIKDWCKAVDEIEAADDTPKSNANGNSERSLLAMEWMKYFKFQPYAPHEHLRNHLLNVDGKINRSRDRKAYLLERSVPRYKGMDSEAIAKGRPVMSWWDRLGKFFSNPNNHENNAVNNNILYKGYKLVFLDKEGGQSFRAGAGKDKADFILKAPNGSVGLDPKYANKTVECKQFGAYRGGLEEAKKAFDPTPTADKPDYKSHAHKAKIFFVWIAKIHKYYFLDYLTGQCEVTMADLAEPKDLY
jgi:hypothetical protein